MSRPLYQRMATGLIVFAAVIGCWELLQRVVGVAEAQPPAPLPPHYTCYVVEGEDPPTRIVRITNQFEKKGSVVRVFSRQLLCVPTEKVPLQVEYAPPPKPEIGEKKPQGY